MEKKNSVFLLIGQRGSGKSYYARLLVGSQPELEVVSRDEILVRLFGSVHTDPYTGGGYHAYELMGRMLRQKLRSQRKTKLILDSWTGNSRERRCLIKSLKSYGAERIVGLYFVTPLEVVKNWFWQKPGVAKIGRGMGRGNEDLSFFLEDAPERDFRLFHELATGIDSDGFDEVIRVNPQDPLIVLN